MLETLKMIFAQMLTVSVITGVLTGAILILTPLLNKRYSPRWRYRIWLIFAVWLILPVTFAVSDYAIRLSVPDATLIKTEPYPQHHDNSVMQDEGIIKQNKPPAEQVELKTNQAETMAESSSSLMLVDIIVIIWLVGAASIFILNRISAMRFRAWLKRKWRTCGSPDVYLCVNRIKDEFGYHKNIDIKFCEYTSSPFVTGLIHPVLVLPDQDYDPNVLSYIVRHELTHCKRYDLWYKLVVNTANAIHWFNPMVWIMKRACDLDIELICDELVTQEQSLTQRREYGESILFTVNPQSEKRPATLTTSFSFGAKNLKERLEAIMLTTTKRAGTAIFALIMSLVILAGCSLQFENKKIPDGNSQADMMSSEEYESQYNEDDSSVSSQDDFSTTTNSTAGKSNDKTVKATKPFTTTSKADYEKTETEKARKVIDDYYKYVQARDFSNLKKVVTKNIDVGFIEKGVVEEGFVPIELSTLTIKPIDISIYNSGLTDVYGVDKSRLLFLCRWSDTVNERYDKLGLTIASFMIIVKENGQWKLHDWATGP